MKNRTLRLIALTLCFVIILFATWHSGYKRGYEKGSEDKGARFQVMLDANVYWAHRDSLEALSLSQLHAAKRYREALGTYFERVSSAKSADAGKDSSIRMNFISRVEQQHPDVIGRADLLIEKLQAREATSSAR